MGFTIFGLTGRGATQKDATIGNLKDVGYNAFTPDHYFTKWAGSTPPAYITCATAKCTTVEYKAGTRKHIEQDLGYDIVLNIGDQWSDLQGGHADRNVKPAQPDLLPPVAGPARRHGAAPRAPHPLHDEARRLERPHRGRRGHPQHRLRQEDDRHLLRRSGHRHRGQGEPRPTSPSLAALEARNTRRLVSECRQGVRAGTKPAVVLDADDTTLWTYDMEVADMKFVFNPVRQDYWVQNKALPRHARDAFSRQGRRRLRLHGHRPDRSQHRPEGSHDRQPPRAGLPAVHRRPLLHEVALERDAAGLHAGPLQGLPDVHDDRVQVDDPCAHRAGPRLRRRRQPRRPVQRPHRRPRRPSGQACPTRRTTCPDSSAPTGAQCCSPSSCATKRTRSATESTIRLGR